MRLKNSDEGYGVVAVAMHWLVAAVVFGMFALGLWMTGLTYYDPWYRLGPWWHKGIGMMLLALAIARIAWRATNPRPAQLPGHRLWERRLAGLVHGLAYLLLLALPVSGYLISTADGRALEVFDWFAIPALPAAMEHQEDLAGSIHWALAVALIALAALHALGALKHHFVNEDRTLLRMLGR